MIIHQLCSGSGNASGRRIYPIGSRGVPVKGIILFPMTSKQWLHFSNLRKSYRRHLCFPFTYRPHHSFIALKQSFEFFDNRFVGIRAHLSITNHLIQSAFSRNNDIFIIANIRKEIVGRLLLMALCCTGNDRGLLQFWACKIL